MKRLVSVAVCLVLTAILLPHEAEAQWRSKCPLPVPRCNSPLVLVCYCDQKTCAWQCIQDPLGPHG